MIINAHLVSDLILATKQEPHSYENDINSEMKSEALQHLDKLTEEDCNNNLNNMSNRNIQIENKMFKFQQSKQETDTRYDEFKSFHSNNTTNNNRQNQLTRCTGCQLGIEDKYVFNLMNTYWHEECLQCSQCRILLKKTCFYKNGLLFCKDDYLKQFGTRCNACFELLNSNELVMRFFINNIGTEQQQLINYHLNCFKCIICDSLLQKGDEFVLKNEGIYCKNHCDFHTNATSQHSTLINRLNSKTYPYNNNNNNNTNSSLNTTLVLTEEESSNLDLNSNTSSLLLNSNSNINHRLTSKQTTPRKSNTNRRITKRPRTILNAVQRYDFREAFKQSPKPCRKVREHLASKTGLTVRVVQVWFQNERAKVKKMQRRQQQHLLNQKLNGKNKCGPNSKMNTKNKKLKKSLNNNKNHHHRKTIDSDSMITTNDEENSLANAANEDEDDYDDYDEEDSEQQSTDDELYSDDELDEEEEEEEEDDDDDDQDIGKLDQINTNNNSGLNQSPNNITTNNNTSSSSSSSISSMNSDYTNNNNSYNNNMHGYHHLNHQQHQQQIYQQQQHFNQPPPQQMIHNPIDRLYSMQNAYFCSS